MQIPESLKLAKGYCTSRDIAEWLGVTLDTITKWSREGKFPEPDRADGGLNGRIKYYWKPITVRNWMRKNESV